MSARSCTRLIQSVCSRSRPRIIYNVPLRQSARPRNPNFQWQSARTFVNKAIAKELWRRHPYQLSLAIVGLAVSLSGVAWSIWWYNYFVIGAFSKFPEPVAYRLRRAIYFSRYTLDRPRAMENYRQAFAIAEEIGMHPFSEEVIGMKLDYAGFFEILHEYHNAIGVLNLIKRDCLAWIERKGGQEPGKEADRNRVLQMVVRMEVKLGELYDNQYVQEPEKAEAVLSSAVERHLKELRRREVQGVKDGEGPWMDNEEIGGTMEALANHYEETDQHYLATPLYIQALTYAPPNSCHSVTLMSSLATSLALQSPPLDSGTPAPSAANQLDSARSWATKALDLSKTIAKPNRTEECDTGCTTALVNLGEFAAMEGDLRSAKKHYEDAKRLSTEIKWEEGKQKATEALKLIEKIT